MFMSVVILLPSCNQSEKLMETERHTLMVLAPGHFHASLVCKTMYEHVDSTVHVYAPEGSELEDYLKRVDSYNNRDENPTSWKLKVYRGEDFLEKMLAEKPGDVVVLSGNNQNKTEYIHACVEAGLHILADKPMAIEPSDYVLLKDAFSKAEEQGTLIYDIMTERFEITTMMQKAFSQQEEIFGNLEKGTLDHPAITKESVHHFFKYVSGKPLTRPDWFFDARQQGQAIPDVGTHLVDLVMWEAFPGRTDELEGASRIEGATQWTTPLTLSEFSMVTGVQEYPDFLAPYVSGDTLHVQANGALDFTLFGTHAHVSVEWAFKAPEGGGDTHYSIMRGTKANLVIRQGPDQGYTPQLYIETVADASGETLQEALEQFVSGGLQENYPGMKLEKKKKGVWQLVIPDSYRVGHEAHFGQVTENFLKYLSEGALPDWEVAQMLAKYRLTTAASGTRIPGSVSQGNAGMLDRDNLVAWCIVPFDAADRSPEERAEMLNRLGIGKFAYDYRDRHIDELPHEIGVLREHGIELTAVWLWIQDQDDGLLDPASERIVRIVEDAGVATEFWVSFPDLFFKGLDDSGKMEKAVKTLSALEKRLQKSDCTIALYNHGDWFGEPENQVRIIEEIGSERIGIVYNFHHAHHQVERFMEIFDLVQPYLTSLNINGMTVGGPKIITPGEGKEELKMLRYVMQKGYDGPIGILGHTEGEDIAVVLERNLEGIAGLQRVL